MGCGAKLVKRGTAFQVYALSHGRGRECPLFEAVRSLDEKGRRKIMSLLDRVADHGVPRNQEISKPLGNGLFELRPGEFRVVFFYDSGRMILCTHMFRKSSQKTPRSEIQAAVRWRTRYDQAKAIGTLEFYDDDV